MEQKPIKYYCYILTNKNRTVLYIGYAENLKNRVKQHKTGNGALFPRKYNVNDLVYFETYQTKKEAKAKEKQLKNWHKDWKWKLIREANPSLKTLDNY